MNLLVYEAHSRDSERKRTLGQKTHDFLGHHYQRANIVDVADHIGDSFGLAKIASQAKDCEYIVFCHVFWLNQQPFSVDPIKKSFIQNRKPVVRWPTWPLWMRSKTCGKFLRLDQTIQVVK